MVAENVFNPDRELRPIHRAAAAVTHLFENEYATEVELQRVLGYQSSHGVRFLMDSLSFARVPVYELRDGCWAIRRPEPIRDNIH